MATIYELTKAPEEALVGKLGAGAEFDKSKSESECFAMAQTVRHHAGDGFGAGPAQRSSRCRSKPGAVGGRAGDQGLRSAVRAETARISSRNRWGQVPTRTTGAGYEV